MSNFNQAREALQECFVELYKNAIPPANFKELEENNSFQDAFYMNHYISESVEDRIITEIVNVKQISKRFEKKIRDEVANRGPTNSWNAMISHRKKHKLSIPIEENMK